MFKTGKKASIAGSLAVIVIKQRPLSERQKTLLTGIIWSGKIMVTMLGIFPYENIKNGNLFPNRELIIGAGLIFGNEIREQLKCSEPIFFRHHL